MAASDVKKITGMSDEAVRAKTGRTWGEWFRVLDKAGAKKMAHRDIADLLYSKHKLPGWWAQMVTVGYERARGLRRIHETASGFSMNRSRTLTVPLGRLYAAWAEKKLRERWLREKFTLRKQTRNKSLRIAWHDGTSLEVLFYPRGAGKSVVTIQQRKLASAKAVAAQKSYWGGKLDRLAATLGA
jgi:hypothetical protein